MRRLIRRWYWWLPAPLALALGTYTAGRLVQLAPGARITAHNAARIHEGMMREEVAAILGPPGFYECDWHGSSSEMTLPGKHDGYSWENWSNDYLSVTVVFDERGRVWSTGVVTQTPPTWLEHVRFWLGL